MQKIRNSCWSGPLLSGILTFIAVCQINFWCSWICYVPVFISIAHATPKLALRKGFLFGATIALLAFFWMIPGAKRFTGHSMLYGFGVMILSLIFLALYHAVVLWLFALLRKQGNTSGLLLRNGLLLSSLMCMFEAALMTVSEGLPWFDEHAGSGLTENLYAIQPASVFGIYILSFVVVLVNYLLASLINAGRYRRIWIPVSIVICYLSTGFIMFTNFKAPEDSNKFTAAILAQNIRPEMRWDENTGDMLVQKLIDLNKTAATLKPNLMLWSESGIPWNYDQNDELVKEVLRITKPSQAVHVLGINTAYRNNEIFNSAYCILPDGKAMARYDKQRLLAFIEKPINGMIVPFSSSNGIIERSNTNYAAPLNTPFGKAGILICNESAVPGAAASMVNQGAGFLLNMSNDGWFNDTYIVRDHYYTARLRAVESRKDLVINSNNGYSGLIKASGETEMMKRSEEPFVEIVTVQPNAYTTLASSYPMIFIYACSLCLLIITIVNRYRYFRFRHD